MRYYASRKVGKRGRVGVGMSDKEVNGCLSALFVWPFKLFYYIVMWPFKWVFGKLRHSNTKAQKGIYGGLAALLVIGAGIAMFSPDDAPEVVEPTPPPAYEVVVPATTPEPTIAPTPEPTPEPTPAPVYKYIGADELNLRAEPSRDADILGEYHKGDRREIVGENGEWYKVDINGTVGYMVKEYIVDEKPVIVYWVDGGEVYHTREDCWTLNRSKHIKSGTIEEAEDQGKIGYCDEC